MSCALAIFAKTPGLSPAKTRLAADIGTSRAEAFYKLSVDCIEETVSKARQNQQIDLSPVWAVAEENGPSLWNTRNIGAIWTGEGGLGQRLANVSEKLFSIHSSVVFIGTDSPQLEAAEICGAVKHLNTGAENAVTGPANDGGFFLFGSRRPVPRAVWESVTYSNNTTLVQLEGRLVDAGWHISRLPTEQDVDTVEDLETLFETLSSRREEITSSQKTLLMWLEENRSLF